MGINFKTEVLLGIYRVDGVIDNFYQIDFD